MAQKIATVSTVFAACDRLDAVNERWNREDVRNAVGGGGYVVIDPLIKAWRKLKPLREAAPATPAELLHQVAETLDAHINGFKVATESRQSERQQVFDDTVAELAEKLATLERELQNKDASLEAMAADLSSLTSRLEDTQRGLSEATTQNTRLTTENDGLRGQIARMEREHKQAIQILNAEATEQTQAHERERAKASQEHALALANQRKELALAAELGENRLMVLLDRERHTAKLSMAELGTELKMVRDQLQFSRENAIALEARIRQREEENGKLESAISQETGRCSELSSALAQQQQLTTTIQGEFTAYQEAYKMGGELGALQAAVTELQAKLQERQDE